MTEIGEGMVYFNVFTPIALVGNNYHEKKNLVLMGW